VLAFHRFDQSQCVCVRACQRWSPRDHSHEEVSMPGTVRQRREEYEGVSVMSQETSRAQYCTEPTVSRSCGVTFQPQWLTWWVGCKAGVCT